MASGSSKTTNHKCFFLPHEKLERALKLVKEFQSKQISNPNVHNQDLLKLQTKKAVNCVSYADSFVSTQFLTAVRNAIRAHEWDKLLFLLSKWPPNNIKRQQTYNVVFRAYIILLIHHPNARAQSLLLEYCHMVLSCRNDDEKKAFLKLLVTLPPQLLRTIKNYRKNIPNS